MSTLTRANAVHIRIQGRQCGPLTQDQVKALVRQGTAASGDSISVDGGAHWTQIGKTSLVKYVPVKRAHGRLQPPIMPDHIDLSVTSEVMALPAPPPEPPAPVVVAAPAKAKPGLLWGVGGGCLAAGLLFGIVVGRLSAPASRVADKVPDGPPPPPVLKVAEVGSSRSNQVVTLVGILGAVEERVEPAQLPGLASRCVLVRIHGQGSSLMVAVPWRETEEPKPNSMFVAMSESGAILNAGAAKMCDAAGVPVPKGSPVKITGKVRFKVSDVPMLFPILEMSKMELVPQE